MNSNQTNFLAPHYSDDDLNDQVIIAHEASLCWQIRDRRWHGLSSPWKAGLHATSFASRQSSTEASDAPAFQVARSLIEHDRCRLRERNGELEIRLVSADEDTTSLMARMSRAEKDARGWLQSLRRAGHAFTRFELVSRVVWSGGLPRIASEPVVRSVLEWARGQGMHPVPDLLFWLTAGFFDPARLFYLRADCQNIPTQLACKCILIDVLLRKVTEPPDDADWDEMIAREWFNRYIHILMENRSPLPLGEAVMARLRAQEGICWTPQMPCDPDLIRQAARDANYCWIANKVKQELTCHRHRRGLRALEIALAMPYERIEAYLNGFVGTFEEMCLKVAQTCPRKQPVA